MLRGSGTWGRRRKGQTLRREKDVRSSWISRSMPSQCLGCPHFSVFVFHLGFGLESAFLFRPPDGTGNREGVTGKEGNGGERGAK